MKQTNLKRSGKTSSRSLRAEIETHFPSLPEPVRIWLAGYPALYSLLVRLSSDLADGRISDEDVFNLAKRWHDSLPPRRGKIMKLSDFMQTEMELGFPRGRRRRHRTKMRRKGAIGRKKG